MLGFGKKTAIGLDISSDSVKLVELMKKGNKIVLLNIGMAKIPKPETLSESKTLKFDQENTIPIISNLLKRCKSRYVVTSVPCGEFVVIKHLKLPVATEKELRESIKFEADEHIPFSAEEVEIDFEIIGEVYENKETLMEVLLVAVKKDIVNQYQEIIKKVGFKTDIISVDTFSLRDTWDFQKGVNDNEVVALIDIGAKTTSINVVEKSKSHFNRVIHLGGNDFTEALARTLRLSLEEAEDLKISKGKVPSPFEDVEVAAMNISVITEDESMLLFSAINSVVNRLMNEIMRSFSYYYTQLKKEGIERIILGGGGAKLLNIDDYLANGLGMPVDKISFFDKLEIDFDQIKKDEVYLQDPIYAVSFGLALRGLNL
ncbi:type IV pilus assembly protein PilM [bacterium]|nr:type IV pilus assembly protein PilM [bacterium]MBU2599969.1 type IV pilus assembly protein PilM [bacterium]